MRLLGEYYPSGFDQSPGSWHPLPYQGILVAFNPARCSLLPISSPVCWYYCRPKFHPTLHDEQYSTPSTHKTYYISSIIPRKHCQRNVCFQYRHTYCDQAQPGWLPWAARGEAFFSHTISLINIFLHSAFFFLVLVYVLTGFGAGLFIPYFNIYFVQHLNASPALFGLIDGGANAITALLTLICASACETIWQDQRDYTNAPCQYSSFTHNWPDELPATCCFHLSFPSRHYGYVSRYSSSILYGICNGEASRISEQQLPGCVSSTLGCSRPDRGIDHCPLLATHQYFF